MQRLCFSVLYQIAYIITKNFHCDAIIPVIKLFWCVALEPMAASKCKPGQSQWALKLESCCDVINALFSTAMARRDNVSAQKAFMEENGCNACRYSACDVINFKPNRTVGVVVKHIAIGAGDFGFDFWAGTGRYLSC